MVDWKKLSEQQRAVQLNAGNLKKTQQADRIALAHAAAAAVNSMARGNPHLRLKARLVWKHQFPKTAYFHYPMVEVTYKVKERPGFFSRVSHSGKLDLDCSNGRINIMKSQWGPYDNAMFPNETRFRNGFEGWLANHLFGRSTPLF